MAQHKAKFDAWNPGLTSEIPAALMPLVTLYRPENSETGYLEAKEAADFCGLKPQDMIALRVSRLAMHETLIRVTADLYVPDGPNYEELGLNLRGMADRILTAHVQPKIDLLERSFADLRSSVQQRLDALLDQDVYARDQPSPAAKKSVFATFFAKKTPPPTEQILPELTAITKWRDAVGKTNDPFEVACLKGLLAIVGGIVGRRGRLMAEKALVIKLAANWVCNSYGSLKVGEMIDPIIREAALAEGYRYLPHQKAPVVLNVKGASAAGKSTIRPLQRKLAERLGVKWQDFALVSPDYWRKYMLEYESLGEDFKYAAMLTGIELEIIDKKLDLYMEEKAGRSEMPHLLIDRFRFDSFSAVASQQADRQLLSRFGETVFMFFVITPPAQTVERAWKRGMTTGRYKAVDDLLYHNIEAYTGMPHLFFTWAKKKQQKVHFEFLDNSVPYGEPPKTVAFGWNDKITILDIDCMRRLSRYQRINLNARSPDEVLLEPLKNEDDILSDCIERISDVTFARRDTVEILGHTRDGTCDYEVDGFFGKSSLETAYVGRAADPDHADTPRCDNTEEPELDIEKERKFTVGTWGRT
jgi:hypothetical protein